MIERLWSQKSFFTSKGLDKLSKKLTDTKK